MDQRPQVRGHHEVRPGRVGKHEPGVFAGEPGLEHLPIQLERTGDLVLVPLAQRLVALGDRVREHRRGALELDVALTLLVERDARAVPDELMRQRP